jgi:hypothetical protein
LLSLSRGSRESGTNKNIIFNLLLTNFISGCGLREGLGKGGVRSLCLSFLLYPRRLEVRP